MNVRAAEIRRLSWRKVGSMLTSARHQASTLNLEWPHSERIVLSAHNNARCYHDKKRRLLQGVALLRR